MIFSNDDGIYLNGKRECYEFILNGKVYKSMKSKKDADDFIKELNQVAKVFERADESTASKIYSFIDGLKQLEFS